MILKYIALAFLVIVAFGYMYQHIAMKLDEQRYRPIGRMIDIGDYKLHMIDSFDNKPEPSLPNQVKPVVIMDTGIGCSSLDWSLVQPGIAQFARVIIYDRAGYGCSDVSSLPRTSENIVEELRSMLQHAGVQGPYILVGYSFGGLNMQLFALKYPDEVAGLILVEAVHENVMEKIPQIFINFKGWIYMRLRGSYVGIIRIMNIWTRSFDKNNLRDFAYKNTIKYFDTVFKELDSITISCDQVKAADRSLGNLPICVVTAGKGVVPRQGPCGVYSQDEVDSINQSWRALQLNLVQKSLRGKQIIAEQSNHNVPWEQPEAIVQAVRNIIKAI